MVLKVADNSVTEIVQTIVQIRSRLKIAKEISIDTQAQMWFTISKRRLSMKTIFLLLILFSVFISMPALGELTDTDLDKVHLIVQEEIKPIKADIVTLKTDGAILKTEIAHLKETVNNGFSNVQKNFDRQNNIIIACIGIPLAILAIGATIWGILANRRSRKDETLEKQIEMLTQEIETLKQQRIVTP